ncbi:glycosyltransferase family 4 protein [Paroceanicella profunda]|uniref:Glycosyltransferase family 4 protein n=1 Tax=Paroceanicella profunda TaxID=2579971 RepID=A0A5B8G1F6_9RHOB|nr:glycosyltransferase family 4 protein [Paroceanicella profunda]QDL93029.1 glycosyltransferase family 4 protein [Paroceanicella profunda]
MRFAVPGDINTRSGGYAYDRAILACAPDLGLLPLPGGFPFPGPSELETTRRVLLAAQGPVLVDGLAYGVLPPELIEARRGPTLSLCHHPLALETGLSEAQARALRISERRALALAAHVIATSETTARDLVANYDVEPARITVAAPGLPRAEAAPRRGSPPVILCLGAMIPRKGHDVLLRALARLQGLSWSALIAGPAPDAGWARRIGALSTRLGLDARVRFMGAQDQPGVEALYAGADIFCLPSRHEGYGMVFAEAMMRGLPVVAARAGAVPEVLPADAGLLAPPGDDAALAEFLALLIDTPEVAQRMGRCGRAHALTLPDWPDTARRVMDCLRAAA